MGAGSWETGESVRVVCQPEYDNKKRIGRFKKKKKASAQKMECDYDLQIPYSLIILIAFSCRKNVTINVKTGSKLRTKNFQLAIK